LLIKLDLQDLGIPFDAATLISFSIALATSILNHSFILFSYINHIN